MVAVQSLSGWICRIVFIVAARNCNYRTANQKAALFADAQHVVIVRSPTGGEQETAHYEGCNDTFHIRCLLFVLIRQSYVGCNCLSIHGLQNVSPILQHINTSVNFSNGDLFGNRNRGIFDGYAGIRIDGLCDYFCRKFVM